MSDVLKYFGEMFEADRNVPESEWFERFQTYVGDGQAGAGGWWPPLSDVWYCQGDMAKSPTYGPSHADDWAKAWALLQKLHADYQASK